MSLNKDQQDLSDKTKQDDKILARNNDILEYNSQL